MELTRKPCAPIARLGELIQKFLPGNKTEKIEEPVPTEIKVDPVSNARISANRLNAMKSSNTNSSDQWDKLKARAAGEACEPDWFHKQSLSSEQDPGRVMTSESALPVKRRVNTRMTQSKLTNTRLKALVETMEQKDANPIDAQ